MEWYNEDHEKEEITDWKKQFDRVVNNAEDGLQQANRAIESAQNLWMLFGSEFKKEIAKLEDEDARLVEYWDYFFDSYPDTNIEEVYINHRDAPNWYELLTIMGELQSRKGEN
jgi:hypothetical protein